MRLLKILGLLFIGAAALFVLIGLFLNRNWDVMVTTQTTATPAQVMPLVKDFRQWSKWTTTMPDYKYEYSPEQGVAGSWMSWRGDRSRAKLILTEVTETGIKYDAQMESDQVNASGEITTDGKRITWKDTGTLPAIIGGYFRGVMNSALNAHMSSGLAELRRLAEASTITSTPTVIDAADGGVAAQIEDAGFVDGGIADAEIRDAGANDTRDSGTAEVRGDIRVGDAGALDAQLIDAGTADERSTLQ